MSRVRGIMQEPHFIEIGRKLKAFREEAGHTQTEAGILLGVTKTTISSWETGRKLPSEEHLEMMVRFYCIPHSYINFIISLINMSKNDLIKTLLEIMNESDPHGQED